MTQRKKAVFRGFHHCAMKTLLAAALMFMSATPALAARRCLYLVAPESSIHHGVAARLLLDRIWWNGSVSPPMEVRYDTTSNLTRVYSTKGQPVLMVVKVNEHYMLTTYLYGKETETKEWEPQHADCRSSTPSPPAYPITVRPALTPDDIEDMRKGASVR
jgi:hypothetical protein